VRLVLFVTFLFLGFSVQASNLPASGSGFATGSPVAQVIEALGEPTERVGGFGCDCAGCRTEEHLYFREGGNRYTITVIDGRVTAIE
jgi:hypothetical protein